MSRVEAATRAASQGSGRGMISRALTQLAVGQLRREEQGLQAPHPLLGPSALRPDRTARAAPASARPRRASRARGSRSATPFCSACSRSWATRLASLAPAAIALSASIVDAAAPGPLGEQGGAAGRRRRREPLHQADEARHCRHLDLGVAGSLPLGEEDAEIDRLRGKQGGRHDQGDLADQAPRQEPPHGSALTAASLPPRACSRRPRPS